MLYCFTDLCAPSNHKQFTSKQKHFHETFWKMETRKFLIVDIGWCMSTHTRHEILLRAKKRNIFPICYCFACKNKIKLRRNRGKHPHKRILVIKTDCIVLQINSLFFLTICSKIYLNIRILHKKNTTRDLSLKFNLPRKKKVYYSAPHVSFHSFLSHLIE